MLDWVLFNWTLFSLLCLGSVQNIRKNFLWISHSPPSGRYTLGPNSIIQRMCSNLIWSNMAHKARGNCHGQTLLICWVKGLDEEPVLVNHSRTLGQRVRRATRHGQTILIFWVKGVDCVGSQISIILQFFRTRNNKKNIILQITKTRIPLFI